MSIFKIATWNVNSLRVRLPHVLAWLQDNNPDIVALQETKVPDADFPFADFEKAGYIAVSSGQKTYNGVAILWRKKIDDIVTDLPGFTDPQRRILAASAEDVRIINLYVPNGESVNSEKYLYKLNWLKSLHDFLQTQIAKHPKLIVLGDFNIAPDDIDVHDPLAWENSVLFSKPERAAFKELLNTGLFDCFRHLNPNEKIFSWWDYRMASFRRNLGLRIDHILASTALQSNCLRCYVDKAPRALERPSDHAPVVAEFAID